MQPPGDDAANIQPTTGFIRSKWNRKRIAALAAAFVLTICLPVAIDQGYFRYNSYFLPLGGLVAVILYIGLLLSSKPMISWLHGLHDRFQNQPLAYVIIVGTAVALLMLFLAGGETLAISKSREHVAELRRRESAATTVPPPVKAASAETARKEPIEQPKATTRALVNATPRKRHPTPNSNIGLPAVQSASASPSVPNNPPSTVGSVTSINQSGGITAGVININSNSLPSNPGYGLLSRLDVDYNGKPLVYLNRTQISAEDKPVGTVYVTVFLSLKTLYEKKKNDDAIQSALKTLTEIPSVKVFYSGSTGGYTLVKDGVATTTGANISGVAEITGIFYFDSKSEAIVGRIKEALNSSRSQLRTLNPNPSNPGLLLNYDIWKASGVDVEVVL